MKISVATPDDADLNSLYHWLSMDDDVTREARLSMGSSGRRTDAQSPLDVIDILLSNATAIGSLLIAYSTWRRTRPDKPSITLEIGGTEMTVHDPDDETIQRLIKALEDQPEEPDEEQG
jgi:hypothetical protein